MKIMEDINDSIIVVFVEELVKKNNGKYFLLYK